MTPWAHSLQNLDCEKAIGQVFFFFPNKKIARSQKRDEMGACELRGTLKGNVQSLNGSRIK